MMTTAEQMQARADRLLEAANLGRNYQVNITGSAENLCDPTIDIEGLTITSVEHEVGTIGGPRTVQAFQVSTVESIPGYRPSNGDPGDPPDEDIKDLGEPHRRFDEAMIEVIKLHVEEEVSNFIEAEAQDLADAQETLDERQSREEIREFS